MYEFNSNCSLGPREQLELQCSSRGVRAQPETRPCDTLHASNPTPVSAPVPGVPPLPVPGGACPTVPRNVRIVCNRPANCSLGSQRLSLGMRSSNPNRATSTTLGACVPPHHASRLSSLELSDLIVYAPYDNPTPIPASAPCRGAPATVAQRGGG